MMLKRYAMAIVLTLFSVMPSMAGDNSDFEATKKLAEQGVAGAQFYLGVMYYNGLGTPKNDLEAFKWTAKAAEQGVATAQFNLGLMYAKGEGVPQNYEQAYIWTSLAAAQSNNSEEGAVGLRDLVAKQLTPARLNSAQQRAAELQKKIAANAKNP